MSDSDSDVPLALLAAKKKKKASAASAPPADDPEEDESSEEEEFGDGDDDDDDDFEEDGDDDEEEEEEEVDAKYYSSDSSEDVPLSKLKSPKKAAAKSPAKKKAAKSPAKKAPAKKTTKAKTKTDTKTKKKAAAKKKSASSGKKSPVPSGKSSSSANRPNLPSFALNDNELDKGLLIQRFLCRWWYAVEWPDPSALPASPPSGYDALNGFPGVYICTKGASIGKIVDKRDKSTAPSFANYARKSSEELQSLLLKALAKQKAQLIEAEGPGTDTEKELDKMEKWTRKLNCKKLDKEAATALKAAGISLD